MSTEPEPKPRSCGAAWGEWIDRCWCVRPSGHPGRRRCVCGSWTDKHADRPTEGADRG